MRVAAIGRTEILFETIELLIKKGYEVPLIITAKEAPEYIKTSDDFKQLAASINAKFIHTPKLNTPEVINSINSIEKCDICVSINYSGIIEENIINLFPLGILNAHAGDLPKYRGNACLAWSIINGEKEAGLCIHKMIGGELDNGNIIEREYHDINQNTTVGELTEWCRQRIPALFLNAVEKLKKDANYILEKQSTDPKDALRGYPRKPEDGEVTWDNHNIDILRLINASSQPFPGAFCKYKDKTMIIWKAEIVEDYEVYLSISGQVSSISDAGVTIICGKGKLLLKDVEYENQRANPNVFIKSLRDRLK